MVDGATRVERFGPATLYLGDCREIAPRLARPAALVSDPPYGQRLRTNIACKGGERKRAVTINGRSSSLAGTRWPDGIIGDDAPFDPAPWLDAADIVLLWGAHKFAGRLPPGQWLVWDKVPTGKVRCQGCGEAAWVNSNRPMRIYRLLWDGLCVGSAARHEISAGSKRVHPAQKPVCLMAWCLQQARVPAGGLVLDPYMGAGATGVAAVQAGHPFAGIEIEPLYFDTACRRIEAAVRAAELAEAA